MLILLSVVLAASAANIHPSFASLFTCSSVSSFLNLCSIPKKISNVPLYLLMYFFSVLQTDPFSKVRFNLLSFFSHLSPVCSFRLSPLFRNLFHPFHLMGFAIKVHFGAFDHIRHDNDLQHLCFPFRLQPPCALFKTSHFCQNFLLLHAFQHSRPSL